MNGRKNHLSDRKGFSLAEIMAVLGLFLVIGAGLFSMMIVIRNTYFRTSARIDLQQQARYGMARLIDELSQSASGKVNIYRCLEDICVGGAVAFQVPVVTDNPVAGSIYKPTDVSTRPIKWGYDGRELPEATNQIIYMVPAAGGPFDSYQNQLIRITRQPFCQDGNCDAGETHADCPEDCLSGRSDGIWLKRLFAEGVALAQTAPDVSGYNVLPALLNPSNYAIRVITTDASAIFFLGTPGPGRSNGSAESNPDVVEIVIAMSKPGLFVTGNSFSLSSAVRIRNLSF